MNHTHSTHHNHLSDKTIHSSWNTYVLRINCRYTLHKPLSQEPIDTVMKSGMTHSINSSAGFTLMEMMATLVIVAILAVLATNMRGVFQENQISSYAQDLMGSLQLARSEAVTRSTRVTVCRRDSSDPNQCATTGRWDNGWLVFVDENNNATVAKPEDILRVHEALKDEFDLYGSGNDIDKYVSFIAAGFPRKTGGNMQSGSLVLCDPRGYNNHARKIIISTSGRMRLVKAGDTEDTAGPKTCP